MTDGKLQLHEGKSLLVGGKLALADACCCDVPPEFCDFCADDEMPFCLEATISGLVNGIIPVAGDDCKACDCLNGETIRLEFNGACAWVGSISVGCMCSSGLSVAVTMTEDGGHYYLNATVAGGGSGATFQEDLGTEKPDCGAWSGLALTRQAGDADGSCDLTGMGLSITSRTTGTCPTPWPGNDASTMASLRGATFCSDCGDTYPSGIYLKIENLDNLCCGNCTNVNGTYFLEAESDALLCDSFSGLCCGFSHTFGSPICLITGFSISFWLHTTGGVTYVNMEVRLLKIGGFVVMLVQRLGEAPIDCSDPLIMGAAAGGVVENEEGPPNACGTVGSGCNPGDLTVFI